MAERSPPPLSATWTQLLGAAGNAPRPHQLPLAEPARPEAGWTHPPSGLFVLPEWSRIKAYDCKRYDEDGADVSVHYSLAGSTTITAYVFPLDRADAAGETAFFNAVSDMLRVLEGAKSAEEYDVAFALAGLPPLRGRCVRAVGVPRAPNATRAVAYVEMFVRGSWAVKLRATSTPRGAGLTESFFEEWLASSGFASGHPPQAPAVARSESG